MDWKGVGEDGDGREKREAVEEEEDEEREEEEEEEEVDMTGSVVGENEEKMMLTTGLVFPRVPLLAAICKDDVFLRPGCCSCRRRC